MLTQTFRSRFRTLRYVESFPHSLFHSSFINSPLRYTSSVFILFLLFFSFLFFLIWRRKISVNDRTRILVSWFQIRHCCYGGHPCGPPQCTLVPWDHGYLESHLVMLLSLPKILHHWRDPKLELHQTASFLGWQGGRGRRMLEKQPLLHRTLETIRD